MAHNKPFIRWAGGKSWLVPYVKDLIEDLDYNDYFEPFMGGASVFFAIDPPRRSVLSDVNEELVNAFCAVRDNHKRVIEYLKGYRNDEDSYYAIRESEPRGKYQRAARFLYLNAFSFNGLYRVNQNGKYNVPYGHRKNKNINYEKIIEVSQKLKNVEVLCQDFDKLLPLIKKGDLVFIDPPYAVSRDNNEMFIKYNSTLFSLDDQHRLQQFIKAINSQKAYFILTNAAHDVIFEIFKDIGRMEELERNSLIGGKKAYRGKVKEYIFTNIPKR